MTTPGARSEMLRAIPHLHELGRITTEEAREFEEAIKATGRDGTSLCDGTYVVPKKMLTRKQVAEILGLSGRTVARMQAAGKIKSIVVGERSVRFRIEDVQALMADKATAA
jgi:excisionase family DNA binding protein